MVGKGLGSGMTLDEFIRAFDKKKAIDQEAIAGYTEKEINKIFAAHHNLVAVAKKIREDSKTEFATGWTLGLIMSHIIFTRVAKRNAENAAEQLKKQLDAAGMNVNVEVYDGGNLIQKIKDMHQTPAETEYIAEEMREW